MVATHQDSDKFILRLPDGMRDLIKATAETNGRSMNSEIIHRLMRADGDRVLIASQFVAAMIASGSTDWRKGDFPVKATRTALVIADALFASASEDGVE